MVFRLILLSMITVFLAAPAVAQNSSDTVTPFSIGKARFKFKHYLWGDELYLDFQVKAESQLKGCELTLSLWYCGERVRWKALPLEKHLSKHSWGPLNLPWEYVLSGQYQVELSFVLDNQRKSLRVGVAKFLHGRRVGKSQQKIYFQNPNKFAQEDKIIKKFYAERIQNAYGIFRNLKKKIKKHKNHKNEKKWCLYRNNFNKELAKERKEFEKYHDGLFARRYGITKASLHGYYNLLSRYCKIHSSRLYPGVGNTSRDSFGLERPEIIENNLKRFLQDAAKDAGLNLKKILD